MRTRLFPILIGIVTSSIFVLLAYSTLLIDVREDNNDKTRITDLVKNEISLQTRNLDVFADMVGAFYMASEQITEKEFEVFVSHMLSDIPELRNIAVMQDGKIIQSYPIKDISLNHADLGSDTVTVHQKTAILIKHTENVDDITVLLFVNPERLISLPDILQEPYKVEILLNNNTIFYDTTSDDGSYFTYYELENALVIPGNTSALEHNDKSKVLTFRIWEDDFTNNLHTPVGIAMGGVIVSVLVSFFAYKNAKTKAMLQEKNKELVENERHMKKLQSLLLESDEKHRNLFEMSPLGIVVLDLNGNITSCNGKAAEIFGYNKNELIGRHFTYFIAEHDISKQAKLFEKVLSEGNITEQPVYCKKKNGTEFQMIVSASTMKDKDAKTSGVIAVLYHASMQ